MRALILGNLRNTLGSTSIAVDAGSPVIGHLIITELMGGPPLETELRPDRMELVGGMKPSDRDDLKTRRAPVDKVSVIVFFPEPNPMGRVDGPSVSVGRLPPYPPNSRLTKRPRAPARGLFLCKFNVLTEILGPAGGRIARPTGLPLTARHPFRLGSFHQTFL